MGAGLIEGSETPQPEQSDRRGLSTDLALYDRARAALAEATEIRLRAERKAGELLAGMKARGERQRPGDNRAGVDGSSAPPSTPRLSDLGVTKTQSSRSQKLAALSDDELEERIIAAKEHAISAMEKSRSLNPKPRRDRPAQNPSGSDGFRPHKRVPLPLPADTDCTSYDFAILATSWENACEEGRWQFLEAMLDDKAGDQLRSRIAELITGDLDAVSDQFQQTDYSFDVDAKKVKKLIEVLGDYMNGGSDWSIKRRRSLGRSALRAIGLPDDCDLRPTRTRQQQWGELVGQLQTLQDDMRDSVETAPENFQANLEERYEAYLDVDLDQLVV
jgi:hypothetical protein